MKCDLCGTESNFDAAFVKNPRSPKTLCPQCWVRRGQTRQIWFLVALLIAGVSGFSFKLLAPESPGAGVLLNFFMIGVSVIVSIVPHELGHAIVARALGWKVYQIVIGLGKPLFKRRWYGILFEFRSIPVAGATFMTPTDTRWFRSKFFLSVLAGPAVNAMMVIGVILICQGTLNYFDFDALPVPAQLFIGANVWIIIVNLWPYELKSGFGVPNDGKQLLQTLAFTKKALQQVECARFTFEALLCRERGDLSGARAWCDEGLTLYPQNPSLLNFSAINDLDLHNYERARETFLKLAEIPDQPRAARLVYLNNLAYADALTENPAWLAEADAYSRDAYAALPWMAAVVGTRGTVLVAMGQYQEGMKLLTKSIADAESPRNKAENCCYMALALHHSGNSDEAGKYLELARELDPKCPRLERTHNKLNPTTTLPIHTAPT